MSLTAAVTPKPKSMTRAKRWSEEVEEAYRFQIAGYRDFTEYKGINHVDEVDRWPHNGYVKKNSSEKMACFTTTTRPGNAQTRKCTKPRFMLTDAAGMYSH